MPEQHLDDLVSWGQLDADPPGLLLDRVGEGGPCIALHWKWEALAGCIVITYESHCNFIVITQIRKRMHGHHLASPTNQMRFVTHRALGGSPIAMLWIHAPIVPTIYHTTTPHRGSHTYIRWEAVGGWMAGWVGR